MVEPMAFRIGAAVRSKEDYGDEVIAISLWTIASDTDVRKWR